MVNEPTRCTFVFNFLSISSAILRFLIESIGISEFGIARIVEKPPLIAESSISMKGNLLLSGYLVWVCRSINPGISIIFHPLHI